MTTSAGTTLAGAVQEVLREEMHRDDRIVLVGEDIGELGGVYGVTDGLLAEFGDERVIDSQAGEVGLIGLAVGMALYGLRPVVELQQADHVLAALEILINEAATLRYRSGGQYSCPLVVRLPAGGGIGGGMFQSGMPTAHLTQVPGLVVAAPATVEDAAGLLRSGLRGEDPVILLEPKGLYRTLHGEPGSETVPFGSARIARAGNDVSVFAYGSLVPVALAAAATAATHGIQVEVVDLRTLVPLDIETVLASIARTGRAVILDEAPRAGSFAAEIAATLAERAILHLEAPVERVGAPTTPYPHAFETSYLPDVDRVLAAIERVANF